MNASIVTFSCCCDHGCLPCAYIWINSCKAQAKLLLSLDKQLPYMGVCTLIVTLAEVGKGQVIVNPMVEANFSSAILQGLTAICKNHLEYQVFHEIQFTKCSRFIALSPIMMEIHWSKFIEKIWHKVDKAHVMQEPVLLPTFAVS